MKLVGRLAGIRDGKAQFSGSLRNQCALADLKMARLLDTIDAWATANGLDGEVEPPHRFEPTQVEDVAAARPRSHERRDPTIIWATGFRPDYSWLARARPRSQRPDPARRRRRRVARACI